MTAVKISKEEAERQKWNKEQHIEDLQIRINYFVDHSMDIHDKCSHEIPFKKPGKKFFLCFFL